MNFNLWPTWSYLTRSKLSCCLLNFGRISGRLSAYFSIPFLVGCVIFDFECWKFVYWFLCFSCCLIWQTSWMVPGIFLYFLSVTMHSDSGAAFSMQFNEYLQTLNWRNQKQKMMFWKQFTFVHETFILLYLLCVLMEILRWIRTKFNKKIRLSSFVHFYVA